MLLHTNLAVFPRERDTVSGGWRITGGAEEGKKNKAFGLFTKISVRGQSTAGKYIITTIECVYIDRTDF